MAGLGGVVLLVESDEVVRTLLALELQIRGIAVHEATDVGAALRVLDADPGAVAALVTELVLGRPCRLTGRHRDECVLEKPFPPDALEATLRDAVARAAQGTRAAAHPEVDTSSRASCGRWLPFPRRS